MHQKTIPAQDMAAAETVDLYRLWRVIRKRRTMILGIVAAGNLITLVVSFFLPTIYMASTQVFPITSKPSIFPMTDLPIGLLPFTGIDYDINKIMAVLRSNNLRINVIKRLNLFGVNKDRDLENDLSRYESVNRLNVITAISQDKGSGIITVSVYNRNPALARDIANTYISELNLLLNAGTVAASSKRLEFLHDQIDAAEQRLSVQRDEMIRFQKKTKMVSPGDETKFTMQLYRDLLSEKVKLQVRMQSLGSALAPGDTEMRGMRDELRALEARLRRFEAPGSIGPLPSLADTPDKLARYTELARNLGITERLYETLMRLYEQTRFEQSGESLYVQVIDPAYTPVKRAKPQRRLMLAAATVGTLFFGIVLAFFLNRLRGPGFFSLSKKDGEEPAIRR